MDCTRGQILSFFLLFIVVMMESLRFCSYGHLIVVIWKWNKNIGLLIVLKRTFFYQILKSKFARMNDNITVSADMSYGVMWLYREIPTLIHCICKGVDITRNTCSQTCKLTREEGIIWTTTCIMDAKESCTQIVKQVTKFTCSVVIVNL